MSVVPALEENRCGNQPGDSSVSVVKGMYGGKEEVGHQGVDRWSETAPTVAVDESNVPIHQGRESLWRRSSMKAAHLASSYLNAQGPHDASIVVFDAGLIRDHTVHGEDVGLHPSHSGLPA